MAVSIKDIAEQCGVSRQAVSYALTGSGRLGKDTRRRIRSVARELGYRPNTIARTMRTGRFNQLAMVTRHDLGEIQLNLNKGACEAAAERDLHLSYAELAFDRLMDEDYSPKVLQELCVDGLLVHYAWQIPDAGRQKLTRANLPLVWLNTQGSRNCVYPDDRTAARDAMARLIALGHRRVGYLDATVAEWPSEAPDAGHYSAVERRQGASTAAAEAGLACAKATISVRIHGDADTALAAADTVLDAHPDVTAWICQHERGALPLLMSALARGLRVPRDLSILTFADARNDALHTGIGLSRLLVPMQEVGRRGVTLLCRQIEGRGDQPSATVAYASFDDRSIAPPAAA